MLLHHVIIEYSRKYASLLVEEALARMISSPQQACFCSRYVFNQNPLIGLAICGAF